MGMTTGPGDAPEGWRTRSGFVLATIGSAVGIGSIWKFPYEVGANGGGAFVLVYAVGLALVVLPLMLAEFALGRAGRADAATSIATVALGEGRSRWWGLIGAFGALTAFAILSYYAVIGGWTLAYTVDTAVHGLPPGTGTAVAEHLADLLASPGRMVLYQTLFLGAVATIVVRGVQRGVEQAMKLLMPLLMVLLVALAAYSLATGDVRETLRFLFVPDLDALSGRGVLDALGLGFFSIGVGLGLLVTYAAYSPPGASLRQVALVSVGADTAVSIVAGLAVFPAVFGNGLDPASGPGLVFVSLPLAFGAMPAGTVAALAFFALLVVAALGSAISLLEGVVAVLHRLLGWSRSRSAVVATVTCWLAGLTTVLSFNEWAALRPLGAIDRYRDATVYDIIDDVTSNVMLPADGLAVAVLCGWVLSDRLLASTIDVGDRTRWSLRWLLRVVAPVTIVAASAAAFID